jgi:hypothetical protein
MFSATDSAVRVFPIPGPPLRSMMMPFPLPEMTSSNVSLYLTWDSAKARIKSFWSSGRTRFWKAAPFQAISETASTKKESQRLVFSA